MIYRIAVIFAALSFSACLVVGPRRATTPKSCPPGHTWSDGQCHSKGKGHDPAKHKNDDKKEHRR